MNEDLQNKDLQFVVKTVCGIVSRTQEDLDKAREIIRAKESEEYKPIHVMGLKGFFKIPPNFGGLETYECIQNWGDNYPRAEDDGRCILCEGWGCCECGHTGGY